MGKQIDYKAAYEKIRAAHRRSALRRQVRLALYEAKAKKAGITVSDAEIDAAIAARQR